MANIYRVGVIGFAHMHVTWHLDEFSQLDNIEWTACADTAPSAPSLSKGPLTRAENLKHALEKTGVPRFYDDYRELLEKEKCDIVIVCPENARHAETIEAVAESGANIIVEKPPAHNFDDYARMLRAVEKAGATMSVNWPSTWSPELRLAKEIVDSGEIGQVFQIKWRQGSTGPLPRLTDREKGAEWWHRKADGGGSLLDYCCYGACISRWILDESPQAVMGMAANFTSLWGDADDNAALIVRFPSAMAILESTWNCVHHGVSSRHLIYGSEGTIAMVPGGVQVFKDRGEGELRKPQPLPENRNTMAKELIHHLETGDPIHPTLDAPVNIDAMAVLDAGLRSAESGQLEMTRSLAWPT